MNEQNLNEEKNDILGELDYLNSFIGLAKSFIKDKKNRELLTSIQNDIFVIQANIADPQNVLYRPENITQHRIFELQKETYVIEKDLKEIKHFVLPEGTTAASIVHCIRTIARQVERKIPGYLNEPTIIAIYFDRVACLLFALARQINQQSGFTEQAPEYVSMCPKKKQPAKGDRNDRKSKIRRFKQIQTTR